jgi:hypothetical protein
MDFYDFSYIRYQVFIEEGEIQSGFLRYDTACLHLQSFTEGQDGRYVLSFFFLGLTSSTYSL